MKAQLVKQIGLMTAVLILGACKSDAGTNASEVVADEGESKVLSTEKIDESVELGILKIQAKTKENIEVLDAHKFATLEEMKKAAADARATWVEERLPERLLTLRDSTLPVECHGKSTCEISISEAEEAVFLKMVDLAGEYVKDPSAYRLALRLGHQAGFGGKFRSINEQLIENPKILTLSDFISHKAWIDNQLESNSYTLTYSGQYKPGKVTIRCASSAPAKAAYCFQDLVPQFNILSIDLIKN